MHLLSVSFFAIHLAVAIAAPAPPTIFAGKRARNAGNGTEDAVGGETGGAEGDEIEQQGEFGKPITLLGGDVKQDTLFPPGENGVFEVEFKNPAERTLTVTENKTPAPPPSGFVALEPVSYLIELADSANNLTLSKVDWILNEGSTLNISQGQIGRFCASAGTFLIGSSVGELEFEAEENELTLTVENMNGEWGIFLPETTAGKPTPADGATNGTGSGASTGSALLDTMLEQLKNSQV